MSKKPQLLKMGVVHDGVFANGGQTVFTSQEHSVTSTGLEWNGDKLESNKQWQVEPLKHISSLALSPCGRTLLVSDTSGGLAALEASTGEVSWQAEPIDEGAAPVWVTGTSVFHSSWGGYMRLLNATTGEVEASSMGAYRIRDIAADEAGHQFFLVKGAPPPVSASEKLPPDVLCRFNPKDFSLVETPVSESNAHFAVSPCGQRVAIETRVSDPDFPPGKRPTAIAVVDIESGQTINTLTLPLEQSTYRKATWTPDGTMICLATKAGHLFLDSGTLDQRGFFEGRYACEPAFSADGSLVLLAAWSAARLVPISSIVS